MEVKVFKNAVEASEFVANELALQVKNKLDSTLGVATGRTMDAIYDRFVNQAKREQLDLSKTRAFAVDEYLGLKKGSPNSYEAYLNLHLFDHLNFNRDNLHVPDVSMDNIDLIGSDYEKRISQAGGVDLQLLGIGLNGHIGLNEPGSAIDSRTRVVALTGSTMNSNKVLFKNEGMPLTAVTIGIGTILEASRIFLVATGHTKAEIVQKVVNGDVNSKIPATALKDHKNSFLILDQEAAHLI